MRKLINDRINVSDKVNINDIDKFEVNYKKCKVITCIHCVADRCNNEICEMYERSFIQEG
ncbi:hypothetical protein [Tepidibacter formicigenes]|jgi:hypothetical protein|uniref:Uncharacterized protein n=1 Tax=Tepidibacter formicigenes DSM 15518 TaxID=1123349 RepID=A0A1M6N1X1_9FIRM|nr:hypothetical protein [Tepidibacter formicigenes]SHJ89648.1 hypothetical protein SAMN02744037_01137 [Tepidibacter formicigenes DSM 15518]